MFCIGFTQVMCHKPNSDKDISMLWSIAVKRRRDNKSIYHQYSLSFTHYNDVIMGTMVSRIYSLTIVYSIVYSGSDQRKHQSSASLAFVLGIHRWPVNSPHKGPVTRKIFLFDDVIMTLFLLHCISYGLVWCNYPSSSGLLHYWSSRMDK